MLVGRDRILALPDHDTVGRSIGAALRRSRIARRVLSRLALNMTRLAFRLRRAGLIAAAPRILHLAHRIGRIASGRPMRARRQAASP
jgi:hypothetical protein